MFSMPGNMEILIVVFVIILLFGGKKIPELARGLGRGIKEFKDGMKQADEDPKKLDDKPEKKEDTEK